MKTLKTQILDILNHLKKGILGESFPVKKHTYYDKYDLSSICTLYDTELNRFDFDDIFWNNKEWLPYDTTIDGQNNGTWINLKDSIMIAYIEGDLYLFKYHDIDRLCDYIRQDNIFVGIDGGLQKDKRKFVDDLLMYHNIINYFDIINELDKVKNTDNESVILKKISNFIKIDVTQIQQMSKEDLSYIIQTAPNYSDIKRLFI